MSELGPEQFEDYFRALHGVAPYPWQSRLARKMVEGHHPGAMDLPTGSGKTACIDVAVFALACQANLPVEQRSAPRRVFFCVNRRIIVDEAHDRSRRIAYAIWQAETHPEENPKVLRSVAAALRQIAGTENDKTIPPLDAVQLRGGIYRDNRWARSITQPTIVSTTLDQLGSRVLFRGYGVSPNTAPIQAALIAYDSLVVLDEAHISEPFRQTLMQTRRYTDPDAWAEEGLAIPRMRVLPMTATPNEDMRAQGVVALDDEDRANRPLAARLQASKPARLQISSNIVADAVKLARGSQAARPAAIGIIVNRVATAREIYQGLLACRQKKGKNAIAAETTVELVIGAMRPVDRDMQGARLRESVGTARPDITEAPSFIVATQCLEVGADYDFDVLITECASLDALRQRFGRLNRAGRTDATGQPIRCHATVVIANKDIKSVEQIKKAEASNKPLDPIYGNAMARTWNWLKAHAQDGVVDFGIDAFAQLVETDAAWSATMQNLLSPSALRHAPVMLPAYVDLWCQTSPRPAPDPDVGLFIHGTEANEPDVQVCWRADLVESVDDGTADWCDTVALLPPSSAECLRMPISRLRRWLSKHVVDEKDASDLLGTEVVADDKDDNKKTASAAPAIPPCVLWRGPSASKLLAQPNDLKPGDTIVLPCSNVASRQLGHLPATVAVDSAPARVSDVAEQASRRARDVASVRIHPALRSLYPEANAVDKLFTAAGNREEPANQDEWSLLLEQAAEAVKHENRAQAERLGKLAGKKLRIDIYPDRRGVVLTSRERLQCDRAWFIRTMDEGDDSSSRSNRRTPVTLSNHSHHVRGATAAAADTLALAPLQQTIAQAGWLHDWGKADERFQAMLRGTDRTNTWLAVGREPLILAKSGSRNSTQAERWAARERAGLPVGFRHEMLSMQLASASDALPRNEKERDLALHLIASHHGRARPFAPVVVDEELPATGFGNIELTHEQRSALIPPHRLDSGIADRFWRLTRRFGWWGLAYLEAVLRLADQQASAAEEKGRYDEEDEGREVPA